MRDNPPLQTIVAWVIITALAVFGIFAPSLFGMDGFKGGYAISFVSFFMVICGIIVIVIYSGRARAGTAGTGSEGWGAGCAIQGIVRIKWIRLQ